jgi:hypothetical protein
LESGRFGRQIGHAATLALNHGHGCENASSIAAIRRSVMTRAARYAYAFLACAYVLGLLYQVFLAGLGLFAGSNNWETHVGLGWMLHLLPILILAAAALARAGRRHWQWALALALVVFVVPLFALARTDNPEIAALHPVSALIAFALAIAVARNSLSAVRMTDDERAPVSEAAA